MSTSPKPSKGGPSKAGSAKAGAASRTKILALFAAFAAGAFLLVLAVGQLLPGPQPKVTGTVAVGGPFALVDENGKAVTEQVLKGKTSLIFFGFTHCPDVCPTALFELSEVLNALGPDANKVQGFFVTVDPERDTPDVMKSYLGSFAPQLHGLSGTPAQIEAITKEYRVFSRKVPLEGDDYTMDHTAVIYLMDKDGNFVAPFNTKRPAAEAAADLKRYL